MERCPCEGTQPRRARGPSLANRCVFVWRCQLLRVRVSMPIGASSCVVARQSVRVRVSLPINQCVFVSRCSPIGACSCRCPSTCDMPWGHDGRNPFCKTVDYLEFNIEVGFRDPEPWIQNAAPSTINTSHGPETLNLKP